MGGMGEHIEKLNARNAVARQAGDILRHGLCVTAGVDNVLRRHLAQVVAERLADTPARRVHQHQLRHVALSGGEPGRVQRLEVQIRQPQLCGGLLRAGNRFGGDLNSGELHVWRGTVQAKAADAAEQIPHVMNL